mmetsp:Transcript_47636/g.112371  ORF Transcript_47636/g.112371 Transcript_47636/m.112371 type:complete len:202 (-) Transcript_47636:742-1347(-)
MEYNGGCVIAMGGKNCLAVASDLRFGLENFTQGLNTPKMFRINQKMFIAMTGLLGDIATLKQVIEYKLSLYSTKESKTIRPLILVTMLSLFLYQNRFSPFVVETIVAGLNENEKPLICTMDVLGATSFSSKFVVSGTCSESLYGICENYWKPGMEPEELFKTISNCLILGSNRDCLSGWGGMVHIISTNGVETKSLKTRMD